MEIATIIISTILALIVIGFLIKSLGNIFAFVFGLILTCMLIPQGQRRDFFTDLCNRMYKKS